MSRISKAAVWVIGLILSGLIGWAAWQVGLEARDRRLAEKERASTLRAEAFEREAGLVQDAVAWSNKIRKITAELRRE